MQREINLEDPAAARTIGRAGGSLTSFEIAMKMQRQHNRLAAAARLPRIPKGVYMFNSHEEADEWLMKIWTQPQPPTPAATQKSTISVPSAQS